MRLRKSLRCSRPLVTPSFALYVAVGGVCPLTAAQPTATDPEPTTSLTFPVAPVPLVQGKFQRSEGIAFNGEGDLYVSANQALWRVDTEGEVTKIADLYSNLGLAAIGPRDILVADFGPTNAFTHGPNKDGIVWRVTPEGEKTAVARGIGDPNFILVLKDGSFLVSDDATDEIFHVDRQGNVSLFTTAVDHPNGLALSPDESTLYIAQTFQRLQPMVPDGRLWALRLKDGRPDGEPEVAADTGKTAANDGLAVDVEGRVYIAANGDSKIHRFDPKTKETEVIARKMAGVASIAFGQGDFDHHSIYVTSTRIGNVWRVPVGTRGAALHR